MNEELIEKLKNPSIPLEEKYQMIEEFNSTDSNGNFTRLSFVDFEGNTHNFIGKNKSELSLDEIVAVKKYVQHLYEEICSIQSGES